MKRLHIVGRHNSGKTTLILKLLPHLKAHGLRVGILKHAPNLRHIEDKGDSSSFFKAGVDFIGLAKSKGGTVYLPDPVTVTDWEKIAKSFFPKLDLLLIEGYKSVSGIKIEVWHDKLPEPPASTTENPPLFFVCRTILIPGVPSFPPEEVDQIANKIMHWYQEIQ